MPARTPKKQLTLPKIDLSNVRLVGYARVSDREQHLELQLDALRKLGVMEDNLHVEKVSGAGKKRWYMDLAIKDLQPGDTFVVWKVDRVARNLRQFYAFLDRIQAAGAQFKSIVEDFDFTTAIGEFLLALLAALAQLERSWTVQRTKAGMEAMRARGKHMGRPVTMTAARKKKVTAVLRKNGNMSAAAKAIGVSRQALYQWCSVERTKRGKYIVKWKKD